MGQNDVTSQEKSYLSAVALFLIIVVPLLAFLWFTKDQRANKAQEQDVAVSSQDELTIPEGAEKKPPEEITDGTEEVLTELEPPTPIPDLPDLYIREYSFDPEPRVNEEVTLTIEIGNKGDGDAGNFHWEWWASEDGEECEEDVDSLDAGDTKTVECEYTYEDEETYETKVIVDSLNEVEEEDEENNEIVEEITPEPELIADLIVTEYSFDPVPEKGVPFEVRIGVTNEGNVVAEDFYWEWWATTYSSACREKISELAPNSTKVATCEYTYNGWSTYKTKAVVDADDEVEESNEENNEYTENVIPIH